MGLAGKRVFILTFLLVFSACSHLRVPLSQKDRGKVKLKSPDISNLRIDMTKLIAYLKPHIIAALEYYEAGDWQEAYDEFQLAFRYLDVVSISDEPTKLSFLQGKIQSFELTSSVDIAQIFSEIDIARINSEDSLDTEIGLDSLIIETPVLEVAEVDTVEVQLSSDDYKNFIAGEIKKLAIKFGEDSNFSLPDDLLEEVELHVLRFQTINRDFFEKAMQRSRKYIPIIKPIFEQYEIPEEIIYMAVIESGFSPTAHSRAHAIGLWQFMKLTGRRYGLRISRGIDERYDPIKSTYAACEYLIDLLSVFGSRSFMLALAAYNTGEGNIQKALKKLSSYKHRSFWALRSSGYLHRETNGYVPQILAAIIIGTNLAKLGFEELNFPDQDRYSMVSISNPVSFKSICDNSDVNLEEIFLLNPDLEVNATHTPARVLNYPLFIPKDKKELVENRIARFARPAAKPQNDEPPVVSKESTTKLTPDSGKKFIHHVQPGETLGKLSKIYGVSVADIQNWNGLRSTMIKKGQRLEIYTDPNTAPETFMTSITYGVVEKQKIARGTRFIYRVSSGNTISDLANVFKISESDIIDINRLSNIQLEAGQSLYLDAISDIDFLRYVVKEGDALATIAGQFGVSIQDLRKLNGLQGNLIYPGDELRIFCFR